MKKYQNLILALRKIAETSKNHSVSIQETLLKLKQFGFALIALILVLPFMQPFPIGPISIVGGMTFAALGWQRLKKYPTPILPTKILNINLSHQNWRRITKMYIFIIYWAEKITRTRLQWFVTNNIGLKFEGGILIAGGVLMAIPFGALPLNNFFPGLAILFSALAQFQKDGLFTLIAIFWLFFSVFYFSIFFFVIYLLSLKGMQYLPDWVNQSS